MQEGTTRTRSRLLPGGKNPPLPSDDVQHVSSQAEGGCIRKRGAGGEGMERERRIGRKVGSEGEGRGEEQEGEGRGGERGRYRKGRGG